MMNPADAMNVSDAMDLLKSVASIPTDIDVSELSVGQTALLPAHTLLARVILGLLSSTDTTMPIREQLV